MYIHMREREREKSDAPSGAQGQPFDPPTPALPNENRGRPLQPATEHSGSLAIFGHLTSNHIDKSKEI